jgi:hypothetical protein
VAVAMQWENTAVMVTSIFSEERVWLYNERNIFCQMVFLVSGSKFLKKSYLSLLGMWAAGVL